ncbi:SNF5-domain-containing protein [Lentinula raphanica]|nr:SNF5-domain-containing protein [Lentinula raphanica]
MSEDQLRHQISFSVAGTGGAATNRTSTRSSRTAASTTPQPILMLAPSSFVPQHPQQFQSSSYQQSFQVHPQSSQQSQQSQTRQTTYHMYQPPQYQQQQQQQAAAAPAVTQNPVSASAQAYFTSYASRLRTGATLLVQPTIFPGGSGNASGSNIISSIPAISTSAYTSSTRATRASRRSRTTINYAEPDDEDDDENDKNEAADPDHVPDAGALDDDANDGDFNAGRAGRGAGRPSSRNVNADQTLAVDGAELDQSYLGKVPPSKFIKSRGMLSSAATMPGGPMVSLDYGPNYGSETTNDQKATTSPPILIPVRVEFDVPESGLRIRDVFLWNLHENDDASGITPEIFAAQFCRDLDIAVDPYAEMVSRQMRAQVEDARGEAWVGWMESLSTKENKQDSICLNDSDADESADELEQEMDLDLDGETSPQINPECRVILSIDVQIATYHLTDHIEWDLLSPLTPEVFSIQLCKDLGLTGEAVPLIAHAVHEELCRHRKDVVEWGVVTLSNAWNDKNPNRGDEIARDRTGLGLGSLGRPSRERDGRYPKALKSAWRDWVEAEEYATRWEELSPEEVERREIERERAGRRLRRETSKWRTRR